MIKTIVLISLMIILCQCTDYKIEENQQLVVEGWIDYNSHPIVILTTTVPINEEEKDINELSKYVIKWAKVTISDGEKEVILTGKYDNKFYPPYIYTTAEIKGELGKNYKLTVEYQNYKATAITTIKEADIIDSFLVIPISDKNNKYEIKAFTSKKSNYNYYKYFTLTKGRDLCYRSSSLGNINTSYYNDTIKTIIHKSSIITENKEDTYFNKEDTVMIKYTHISQEIYNYWDRYDKLISISKNVFTSYSKNLPTNINGGYGLWTGYGANYYKVIIEDALKNGGCVKP